VREGLGSHREKRSPDFSATAATGDTIRIEPELFAAASDAVTAR